MVTFLNLKNDIVFNDFDTRQIKYAFHDIDGTHSLIRDWPPVMSIVLDYVICNGLPDNYDNENNLKYIISITGKDIHPETDKFCIESAGLSALTQMEWAIRKAISNGKISVICDIDDNNKKIELINNGIEVFTTPDSHELHNYLLEHTPRLFKFYEKVLNGYCRDKNLAIAKSNPDKFLVDGSKYFLKLLHDNGVINYFVTGAVVQKGMGMHEEVETLGFKIGHGEIIEDIIGSTWNDKLPKDIIMENLIHSLNAKGNEILVCGDGRSEISAGINMGALCISRLGVNEQFKRNLHIKLGTNIIIDSFNDKRFLSLIKI